MGARVGNGSLPMVGEPAKCTKIRGFAPFFWLFCTKMNEKYKKQRVSALFCIILSDFSHIFVWGKALRLALVFGRSLTDKVNLIGVRANLKGDKFARVHD